MIEVELRVEGERHVVRMERTDAGWVADVDGERFPVRWHRDGTEAAVMAGQAVHLVDLHDAGTALIDGRRVPFSILGLKGVAGAVQDHAGALGPMRPPMTGRIEDVLVKTGQTVTRGDVLFVLEAMKMRNEVKAPADAKVAAVHASAGDTVDTGTVVLELVAPA